MTKNRQGGFTVLEVLLVVVVIAILALISIIAYNGLQSRAYYNRAQSEMSQIAKAIHLYYVDHAAYPEDVDRNVPAVIQPYINGRVETWPKGTWPNSVYDYDYFIGSDGEPVSQISIRFCPLGGSLASCSFPDEEWARDFRFDSSVYWCVSGKCRAHPSRADSYPGYCMNCRE